MRTCVSIASYGRHDLVIATIAKLLNLMVLPDEIILVDQVHPEAGSLQVPEGLRSDLQEAGLKTRLYRLNQPSLEVARNIALQETDCDLILYLDDDVIIESEIISAHVRGFLHPWIVGVGGRVLKQVVQSDGTRTPWPVVAPADGLLLHAIGCNMSFRTSALLDVGGFDEGFDPCCYGEDVEICLRLADKGGRIRYQEEAVITHLKSPTGGDRSREGDPEYLASLVRNNTLIWYQRFGIVGLTGPLKHPRWWRSGQHAAAAKGWLAGLREVRRRRHSQPMPSPVTVTPELLSPRPVDLGWR